MSACFGKISRSTISFVEMLAVVAWQNWRQDATQTAVYLPESPLLQSLKFAATMALQKTRHDLAMLLHDLNTRHDCDVDLSHVL